MGTVRNSPPKNNPQEAAPERAARTPELDAVPHAIEADDLLLGMIAFAHEAEVLHFEPGVDKTLDGFLRRFVVGEDGYGCLLIGHANLLCDGAGELPARGGGRRQAVLRRT